jgi:hypothetical protein
MASLYNVGMIRRFGLSFSIPFPGLLKQELFLLYRGWEWDLPVLSGLRMGSKISFETSCYSYNITLCHKPKVLQHQKGTLISWQFNKLPEETTSTRVRANLLEALVTKIFQCWKENVWATLCECPLCFWLFYPASYTCKLTVAADSVQ